MQPEAIWNNMQNNFIVLHAQNTTALQPNLFLTVLHQLLITSKGRSILSSSNHCQCQLKIRQSVSIVLLLWSYQVKMQQLNFTLANSKR